MQSLEQFYIIVQPGMEEELQREIVEVWPFLLGPDSRPNATPPIFIKQEVGGWLIEAPLILGLQLNYFLRLASRILLRLDEFKVRDFSKLYDRFKKLNLESYFSKLDFQVEVSAAKSRLNNEKRIAEVARKAWPKAKDEALGAVMIRMYDDVCSISIDTTGAHLHRRGSSDDEKWIGEAPLRETLAAFILKAMIGDSTVPELQQTIIWDPMAGSGTIIKEASQLFEGNYARPFSFQQFAKTPKLLKLPELQKNYPHFGNPFREYWGSDKDEKMLKAMSKNLANLSNKKLFNQDLFERSTVEIPPGSKLWLIMNPPYGERLEFKEGFRQLGISLSQLPAERIGLILPKWAHAEFVAGLNQKKVWKLRRQNYFKNGGIPVDFSVFG